MLCKKPYLKGIQPYPCGQCLPCRLNRRRLWTHRIILEAKLHERNSFVTLTYDQAHYPESGSLSLGDYQRFLKRLRKRVGAFRYFIVGEYGTNTWRAHYHAALFGVGAEHAPAVQEAWSLGFTHCGDLTADSAQYIAGYVVKKLTRFDDPALAGRHPEFARMSLRPGIGAGFAERFAAGLNSEPGATSIGVTGDVPATARTDGRHLPLGRYLRRKLREELGFDEVGGQAKAMELQNAEMQILRDLSPSLFHYRTERPFVEHQRVAQVEGRAKIFSKKESL